MAAEPFDLEALVALQRQTQELADAFAPPAAGATYTGEDPDETIRVVTDGLGLITGVEVDRDWRTRVADAGLGTAIRAALDAATAARFAAWSTPTTPAPGTTTPTTTPDPAPASGLTPGDVRSSASVGAVEHLLGLLAGVEADLDQLNATFEAQANAAARPVAAASPDRKVEVTVSQGAVTGVVIDPRWLAHAGPGQIASSVQQAVRSAQESAAAASGGTSGALASPPALAELQALTADPDALLRQLGLIR